MLTPIIKYIILLSFVICLFNYFFKNILKSQCNLTLVPLYLTFFTFLHLFKHYHLQHDYFVIKFHILGMLSFIPLIYIYSLIINKFHTYKIIIETKNYFILFIFYFYFFFEIKDIFLLL